MLTRKKDVNDQWPCQSHNDQWPDCKCIVFENSEKKSNAKLCNKIFAENILIWKFLSLQNEFFERLC